MDEMEDFLKVEAIDAPEAAEPIEAPEPEVGEPEKAEQPRGPDGKFLPKGEKEPETPAVVSPTTEEPRLEHPALIGERRRRQEAEARLAELEARLAQPPQPAPDMFENPEGWQNHFGQSITQNATQFATLNAKLEMSEMLVAQSHDDFDDVRPKILALMEENPAVRQEVLTDRHPWAKAYRMVKNAEAAKALGATDVDSLRAKIEADLRAKLEAEYAAKAAPPIPETLADAQSARGSSASPVPAVLSLDDILRR